MHLKDVHIIIINGKKYHSFFHSLILTHIYFNLFIPSFLSFLFVFYPSKSISSFFNFLQSSPESIPWGSIFLSPALWTITACNLAVTTCVFTLMLNLPLYYSSGMNVSLEKVEITGAGCGSLFRTRKFPILGGSLIRK